MSIKILTIEDSKTIRIIVGKTFKPFDCEVLEASNGLEGLAVAAREKPNLILLDLTMPVMDGVETLVKLKSDPNSKLIPVMMLTAESGRENVLKIAKHGIRDYLVKPFKESQLIEKAGRIVNLQVKSGGKVILKTVDDPASILVVDDKPVIVHQLVDGLASTPWGIVGTSSAAEAIEETSRGVPDAVLLSLSLPDDGGFQLFQQMRSNARTRFVPILGMCIKTDVDSQTRAEQIGFNGVITKPIDVENLQIKLIRAMNLDTSPRYFSSVGDIQYLTLPAKVTSYVMTDLERYLIPKIQDMVNAGTAKLVFDLSKVGEVDMALIKVIISTIQYCQELSIRFRIVGTPALGTELKAFQETSTLAIDQTVEEARRHLEVAD